MIAEEAYVELGAQLCNSLQHQQRALALQVVKCPFLASEHCNIILDPCLGQAQEGHDISNLQSPDFITFGDL